MISMIGGWMAQTENKHASIKPKHADTRDSTFLFTTPCQAMRVSRLCQLDVKCCLGCNTM